MGGAGAGLGRNAELGIVAQQRVMVALLEVVCESVEKVEELSDGPGRRDRRANRCGHSGQEG